LVLIVKKNGRIAIKTYEGAIRTTNTFPRSYNNSIIDLPFLHTPAWNRFFDANLNDVTNVRISSMGAAQNLNAHDLSGAAIIGDIEVGLHLNHFFVPD
jgi:hypothetical protein